jgi:hypothetical protein
VALIAPVAAEDSAVIDSVAAVDLGAVALAALADSAVEAAGSGAGDEN